MSNLVYFSSVSENTHRFVQKLELPAIRIPLKERIQVDEPTCSSSPPMEEGTRTVPIPIAGDTSPSR